MGSRRGWRRTLLRTPLPLGQGIYNAIVSKYSLKHFHRDHGYYDMDNLTPAVLDYEWTTGHQPGARFAPRVVRHRLPSTQRKTWASCW